MPHDLQVRGLLWKLQAVFDLPRRLHAAIDNGAYEIAVRSYADAEPLLKRYGYKVGGSPHVGCSQKGESGNGYGGRAVIV